AESFDSPLFVVESTGNTNETLALRVRLSHERIYFVSAERCVGTQPGHCSPLLLCGLLLRSLTRWRLDELFSGDVLLCNCFPRWRCLRRSFFPSDLCWRLLQ